MTEPEFLAIFSRLCVALREPQDDTGISQMVYFEALRDLPEQAVHAGAHALSLEHGRRFFPTTAEWRTAADAAQQAEFRRALPAPRDEPWHHDCGDCEDTGWVLGLSCPGDRTCGRPRPHLAHSYTVACPCRASNQTYLRKHAVGGGAS